MDAPRTGPRDLTRLLGSWSAPGVPANVALARRVRLLVLDGRLPVGVRLPPERALSDHLGVSRTTVTAAYDRLRASGHAASRQGSGTWTSLPRNGSVADTDVWAPLPAPDGVIDLAHAAPAAPPQLHAAFTAALDELPRHLPDVGYDHRGLPGLRAALARRFTERGLPTAPDQVLVTSGALQAIRLALSLVVRHGDRVAVEQPGYPNGLDVVADLGARSRPVPVDPDGGRWDLAALESLVASGPLRAAYLVPDFQNPTGAVMDDDQRARAVHALDRAGALTVADETLVDLRLDGGPAPEPFGCRARSAPVVTVGSASKLVWGGLRVGWLRSDVDTVARLAARRARLDLAGPVLEQLAVLHLLEADGVIEAVRAHRATELRERRDLLLGLLAQHLPDWSAATPSGGQVLWCRLPRPASSALAQAAQAQGVRVSPGPRFAADGTLESWVRLPFTRPAAELELALPALARAWEAVARAPRGARTGREQEFVV